MLNFNLDLKPLLKKKRQMLECLEQAREQLLSGELEELHLITWDAKQNRNARMFD